MINEGTKPKKSTDSDNDIDGGFVIVDDEKTPTAVLAFHASNDDIKASHSDSSPLSIIGLEASAPLHTPATPRCSFWD